MIRPRLIDTVDERSREIRASAREERSAVREPKFRVRRWRRADHRPLLPHKICLCPSTAGQRAPHRDGVTRIMG